MSVAVPGPFKGGSIATWNSLLATDQGATPAGNSAYWTTGTGFSSGTFTFNMAGDVTIYNTARSGGPVFSKRLLDLVPDFNPETDTLDLCIDMQSMPTSTAKYRLALGLFDNTVANLATANGAAVQCGGNTATLFGGGLMQPTSMAADASVGSVAPDRVVIYCRFLGKSGNNILMQMRAEMIDTSGGRQAITNIAATSATLDTSLLSSWSVMLFAIHMATTTGTPTMACSVKWRHARTSGIPL